MLTRALISVFDKNGVLDLAKFLVSKDVEILSTGGTYKYLKENGIAVTAYHRVKTALQCKREGIKSLPPHNKRATLKAY